MSRLKRRHVIPWVGGSKIVAQRGWHGITGNIYCGLHEAEPMQFLLDFLRPGSLFIDGGANMGSYTVLASSAVGCRTIAIEPLADLTPNIDANGIESRVDVRKVALSDVVGLAFMSDAPCSASNRISSKGTVRVETVPLDSLPVPDLLKLDLEGHESKALEGGRLVLDNPKLQAVLIESHGEKLRPYGFEPCAYDIHTKDLKVVEAQRSSMGVWVRDVPAAQKILCGAPPRCFSRCRGWEV